MRDLVLIPTFARPEYLSLCLEYLAKADGAKEKEVWISHDRHTRDNPGIGREVSLSFDVFQQHMNSFAGISFLEREPHNYVGNPLNFLELYRRAHAEEDVRYVYLVEDDVFVYPDFFRWHEAMQARGVIHPVPGHAAQEREDFFCTVGWHCVRNPEVKPGTDPTEYIESTRDFSSIGVCWKREKLAAFVKHATPEFYGNMGNYLARAFPGSPIPPGQWTEQAGVVTRLLHETRNRWVAWPVARRCSHVGVSGYHRPNGFRFHGELKERVKALRAAISTEAIVGMNKDFGGDIEPYQPTGSWTPEQLHVIQRFPYVPGKI